MNAHGRLRPSPTMRPLPAWCFTLAGAAFVCAGACWTELEPGGPEGSEQRSAVATGAAAPSVPLPGSTPIRVVVVSDLNGSYGSTTYAATVSGAITRTIELRPDLVLSTGDMVAGQRAGIDYAGMWNAFHDVVTNPLAAAAVPFAPTPGNHDASGYPAYANERAMYVAQWNAHRPNLSYVDDSGYPLRYSFVKGPALFVSLDATTIGPLSAEQKAWVERQLVLGDAFPVKIVYGHVPLYAFSRGRETEILNDPAFESMLKEHGVSMFISGHHHAYYPGKRQSLRLVGTPCLGDGPRALLGTTSASQRSLLVLEIDESGVTSVDAYAEPAFTSAIPRSTLPTQLHYGGNTIDRDDQ